MMCPKANRTFPERKDVRGLSRGPPKITSVRDFLQQALLPRDPVLRQSPHQKLLVISAMVF